MSFALCVSDTRAHVDCFARAFIFCKESTVGRLLGFSYSENHDPQLDAAANIPWKRIRPILVSLRRFISNGIEELSKLSKRMFIFSTRSDNFR